MFAKCPTPKERHEYKTLCEGLSNPCLWREGHPLRVLLHTGTCVDLGDAPLRGLRLEDIVAKSVPTHWPIGVQGLELVVRMHLRPMSDEQKGGKAESKGQVA